MTTAIIYDQQLAGLAHRAARVGCYIDVDDIQPGEHGPFVLRNACYGDGDGYDAHAPGCDLDMIELAILQIEVETAFVDRIKSQGLTDIPKDLAVSDLLDDMRSGAPRRPRGQV